MTMSSSAIRVEGLGKLYQLAHESRRHESFRDLLTNMALAPLRRLKQLQGTDTTLEDFWALRDVSFDVREGEVVGIVGRNGAGKSTLLKLLARIVEPTVGRATLRGRVASLLEVGTGFHPELSGRENIYLNGSILGMKKREIDAKFDEIVAFAEVERFLDTPVKRYSSGMYVRLAFAVAANLEPEILIVDEVLAVGDAEFQKKCLGKMKEVSSGGGRTVLFVSHNMAAVRALCTSCVLLDKGTLRAQGSVDSIVSEYLRPVERAGRRSVTSKYGIELTDAELVPLADSNTLRPLYFDEPCELRMTLGSRDDFAMAGVVVRIHDQLGTLASTMCTPEEGIDPFTMTRRQTIRFHIPKMSLMPGRYTISVYVFRPEDGTAFLEAEAFSDFEVLPAVVRNGMWPYQAHHGVARIADGVRLE